MERADVLWVKFKLNGFDYYDFADTICLSFLFDCFYSFGTCTEEYRSTHYHFPFSTVAVGGSFCTVRAVASLFLEFIYLLLTIRFSLLFLCSTMEHHFSAVDAELDALEQDFASGEMNAFGTRESQHEFFSSFKRIADLESEVFYKTCAILKSNKTGEQNAFRSAVSMSRDHGGNLGDSFRSVDTSTNLGATDNGQQNSTVHNGSFSATFRAGRFAQWQGRSEESNVPDLEGESGVADQDKAFANVARHFQVLETEFSNVSESLHDISREVIRIDLMAEKLNNTYHAEEEPDE